MEKNGVAFGDRGPLGSCMARNCTENTAPRFKQKISDDYFSSDTFLVVKSSLIRNLHFASLQNAFGGPFTKPGPLRPAKKSEPFP